TVTPKPAKVITTATICSGDTYTWSVNSTAYTTGGTYTVANNGCTADQELQLTVSPKPAKVITTATICSGDTYTWPVNSTAYTTGGTYTVANNGCTADQELQLTVTPKPAKVITTATICSGDTYTWSVNSANYTAGGTYVVTNNGCTADQELQLTVTPKPAKVVTTATICSGDTYTWSVNSANYTTGGTYTVANNGCTADQELQLTVTPKPAKVITTATICSGDTYNWTVNSTAYTAGGTYTVANNGCTADQELHLTVTPKPTKVVTTATICSGDTYNWTVNSTAYTAGGTYTVANNGCTADQELQLTVMNLASPIVGLITQPTCTSSTASVELSGLPTGSWTINPGNIIGNTATTTITGLIGGNTYNYTVTDSLGCQSAPSSNVAVSNYICAEDDTPSIINGATGGTISTVFANDKINGSSFLPTNVTVSTSTLPTGIVFNSDGTITVASNTLAGTHLITYTICMSANTSICDSATVEIVIERPVIDAVTEITTAINSNNGGTTISLTANDTLNGTPVTVGTGAGKVTFTLINTLPTGLTINADKTITVAPGTASGNYEVEYTICDNDHALNCDTVKSYISVTGDTLVANTDSPASVTQSTTAQTIITVISNDTRNGQPLTASEVKITTTVQDPSGYLTLDPTTGVVTLGANAPAGTYTLTYSICDKSNTSNCSTAIVNLTVNAPVVIPVIDAVTETTTAINSNNGGTTVSLITNDTLNGTPVIVGTGAGQVGFTLVSTLPAGLTLNADKTITVAPGTASGNYEVEYTICDNDHTLNCDTVKSYVQVTGDTLVANTDNPSAVTQSTTAQTIITVISNDTRNGQPLTASEVKITTTVQDPSGYLTLDPTTGVVTLGANAPAGTYTLTYSICDKTNTSNCSTATANLTVNAPVVISIIDAVTETTTAINSNVGGTTISLTANDTLNGTPVTVGTGAGQVGFTLISTLPTGLTINADKTITVAPGTASGSYEVEYTICDNDHALNCDTVKSYVSVTGDTLVANTDNPSAVTQSTSAQTIITVINNDTRNGQPLTASEVKITTTVQDPSGYLTLDPATGVVTLGANAPAGTYTLTYSICDKTNTSNCSTASVNLTVNAPVVIPVIDAVTETTTAINSNAGGTTISLTANDTLNGTPVTVGTGAGEVTFTLISTLPTGLTINADKTITVAPGTASGNYEVEYTICDNDHTLNCDTVKSYVSVTGDTLIANTDAPSPVTQSTTAQTIITVVNNDTRNGQPLTASEVKITTTVQDPSGYLTLDPTTGVVTLGANAPAGTYTLTYSICDKTNTSNCSTASVNLTVNAPVVIPVIDAVTETTTAINSNAGGTTISLTANDTLNGTPVTVGTGAGQVGFTLISTLPSGLTLNADKAITVAPGTASGNYEVEYTICDNDHALNCDTVKSYVQITGDLLVLKDDVAGPIAGVNHAVTVINVLGNDTKNGLPITASDVNLSVTIADPSGYLTLNPDGTIVLKENAPAGTYGLTYQVCELNTTNCATANVKVTVVLPTMTVTANSYCSNDVPYVSYNVTPDNFTTNNLLTVKWIDSANNVVATQTNLPLSGNILWPGAIVDGNGIGVDWPGWLLTNGQWTEGADGFEKTRTGVTMEFSLNPTVSVAVSYPPATPQCNARPTFEIKANNDSAGPIDAKKGISTALNIFSNDRLNQTTVNQTAVVLSTVVANPNLILNADGSVDVKTGTPSGTYQLTYQICEASNLSNCSQAVVNVTVVNSDDPAPAPQIITKDDLQVNVDGINGQLEFINILDNDLLNNLPIDPANVVISNTPKSPYFEFNADGTVNVKPNTPGGTYALTYQVCEKANASNCSSATLNVFVEVPNIAIIKTAVFNDENGNGFANAGETITYKFKVTNTGNVPLTKITVKDPLPGVVVSGQAIDLAVGEANQNNFTAQYKITQSDIILGTVSNQATAIGFSARGVDVEDKSDDESNTGDNPTVLSLDGCKIKVLNAFSPNGDSKNARFYIQGIECYPENTVEIYNRWGVLVFDTDHYNNQDRVFVGVSAGRATVKESDGLPVGTYFYVLKYKDNDSNPHEQSGYLYLNK
ncbi:gliding motility-associated C-terminal domain-containing protein, partial [Flavobacterium sp. LC2016-01]|uniref:gliding motility-associated C-terminal domain-containing protein n=1 Tax=Flavobacterium sp. LC2016-01 TaxID=2675876 RepID=UPI0012BA6617